MEDPAQDPSALPPTSAAFCATARQALQRLHARAKRVVEGGQVVAKGSEQDRKLAAKALAALEAAMRAAGLTDANFSFVGGVADCMRAAPLSRPYP